MWYCKTEQCNQVLTHEFKFCITEFFIVIICKFKTVVTKMQKVHLKSSASDAKSYVSLLYKLMKRIHWTAYKMSPRLLCMSENASKIIVIINKKLSLSKENRVKNVWNLHFLFLISYIHYGAIEENCRIIYPWSNINFFPSFSRSARFYKTGL